MEVLFVTHKYPPSIGGMERQSFHLVEGMRDLAEVHLIKPEPGQSLIWWYISLIWKVNLYLSQNPNISVIHANDGLIGILCSFIRNKKKYKLSCTIHGLDITFPNVIYQKYLVPRLKKYHRIIAVSTSTEKECLMRGLWHSQVKTILNGVEENITDIPVDKEWLSYLFEELNIDTDKRIIVSSGRAVKRKGFSWFVKNVLRKLPKDVIYIVIGPMNEDQSLIYRLINKLPQSWSHQINLMLGFPSDTQSLMQLKMDEEYKGRFFHLGRLSFPMMMSCISIADIVVMPNITIEGDYEGFGLVSLEANLRNKIVLASDIEGIKDAIVSGKNGMKIKSGDSEVWVDTINYLLSGQIDLQVQGKRAKDFVLNNFSWDQMVISYFEEFSYLYDLRLAEQSSHLKSIVPEWA